MPPPLDAAPPLAGLAGAVITPLSGSTGEWGINANQVDPSRILGMEGPYLVTVGTATKKEKKNRPGPQPNAFVKVLQKCLLKLTYTNEVCCKYCKLSTRLKHFSCDNGWKNRVEISKHYIEYINTLNKVKCTVIKHQ